MRDGDGRGGRQDQDTGMQFVEIELDPGEVGRLPGRGARRGARKDFRWRRRVEGNDQATVAEHDGKPSWPVPRVAARAAVRRSGGVGGGRHAAAREPAHRGHDLDRIARPDQRRRDDRPRAHRRDRAERAAHGAGQAQRARSRVGGTHRAAARQRRGRAGHRLRAGRVDRPAGRAHAIHRNDFDPGCSLRGGARIGRAQLPPARVS